MTISKAAETEIISALFFSAAEQMRRTLVRTAFNAVIYEVLDFGISIADAEGRMVAEAAGITSFIGGNDYALKMLIQNMDMASLRPGDVVILNYPYWNSAHMSDALLMAPVFVDGDAIDMFLCVRAHWLDLGAKDPGYVIDSTNIHQEGLILPGVRIIKEGKLDADLWKVLEANSRLPEAIRGDFGAQVACLRTGEASVRDIYRKFGRERVLAAIEAFFIHADEKSRQALQHLPKGAWSAEEWLDDDGVSERMIKMAVDVTITDDRMTVDYNRSDPIVPGPVNVPFGATISMAKTYFKFLTSPDTPSNHGNFMALDVRADPGNLFHAVYPSSTYMPWTHMVAFELIAKALAPAIDWLPMASGGDEPGFMAIGRHHRTGKSYVISNNEGIGWGATYRHDGATALQHPSTSTVRNTPIEVLERQANLFHEGLELIPNSGGKGRYRGGLGVRRAVRMVGETEIISMKKKSKTGGWGLEGGQPSPVQNHMVLWPDEAREKRVGMYRAVLKENERFVNYSAGGSGWGDPAVRDPGAAAYDIANGYVDPAASPIEPVKVETYAKS
ncbi:N-methylhydantoinase B [Kaistia soli DSM 19436]|uniref:N-methylhydantoinase B n=1 Tax=Kaistia soli DSM 19436 TaxID=1122133 RepID=A0A1M5E792_9HYPH|nr:hydantoinase B/oxoprolinase family protein [Kaistia soli]SHF74942.1 N-methylhydantoinase B [Kaistia soli DSM 19436]